MTAKKATKKPAAPRRHSGNGAGVLHNHRREDSHLDDEHDEEVADISASSHRGVEVAPMLTPADLSQHLPPMPVREDVPTPSVRFSLVLHGESESLDFADVVELLRARGVRLSYARASNDNGSVVVDHLVESR